MTNEELSIIWKELYEQRDTIEEIAKKYQKSSSTIHQWLKKRDTEIRHTKQAKGTWKDVPIEKAKELYGTGISISEVARQLGFDKGMVGYALKKNGVKTTKRNNVFTDDEVSSLYEEGCSLEKIAQIYSVGRCKIRTALEKNNTDVRDRLPYDMEKKTEFVDYSPYELSKKATNYTNSPSKYSNSKKVFTNENFFNKWSHELAYFLGWMASDGNISGRTFRITSTDIEHLKKLFSLFSYGWNVSMRKWNDTTEKNNSPAGTIAIARKDIVDKMINFGITPNKSLTIKMPNVPTQYLRDFVRGVFEGDGCLTIKTKMRKKSTIYSPSIVFASGSREFLEGLGEAIERQTGLKIYVSVDKRGTWRLDYSSTIATEIFFHYMYDGVPQNIILDRKYNKFLEYFILRNEVDVIDNNKYKGNKR